MYQAPPPRPIVPLTRMPKTSGLGVAGLVLGLLGFCAGITSLPAVICSHLSLRAIRRSGGELSGRGMAITGLVLGYLGLAGLALFAVFVGAGAKQAAKNAAVAKRAATLSLLFAEHEPRLAGCVAYAPAADVEARLKEITDNPFSNLTYPEIKTFLKRSSPKTHADQLAIPAFVFHAADDKNVPAADTRDFTANLKARGADVTFREVPKGGHYEAMIEAGIPAGIEWMKRR
jgi:hypothetical protein